MSATEDVAKIIERHLPGHSGTQGASMIVFAAHVTGGDWYGWSPKKERRRFEEIRKHVVKAQQLWRAMHPVAQLHVRAALRDHKSAACALLDWDDFPTTAFPEAMQSLEHGRDPGKTRTGLAAEVLRECQKVWQKRTGRKPSAGSAPFCVLVQEVFDALDIETDVKTAFNTLARLRGK